MNEDKVTYRTLYKEITQLRADINERFDKLEADYVHRTEFEPVRNVVYGLITLILVGMATAIISTYVQGPSL